MGSYLIWHHEHAIEPVAGGVLMKDIVSYLPPFGIPGRMANRLFIRKQLDEIFEFRKLAVEKEFGRWK